MKPVLFFSILLFVLSSCCSKRVPQLPKNEPPLGKVVSVIQQQYAEAIDTLKKKGIDVEINEADLSLQVSRVSTINGDITVAIFKPSSKYINTRSTKVTYVLKKEQSEKGGGGPAFKTDNTLRDLIVNAATKFHDLDSSIGDLTKDSFSLDIIFAIEWDNSLTLTFKIFGEGADLGYEYDYAVQHEMVLTFNPKNKKP